MEKEVYKGKIIRVTEEKIHETVWERAYLPDGVIIFPITEQGKILLIEEKRPHENPNIRLKAVSGILEHDKGSPEENAQRELQEEIGFKAGKLESLMVLKGSGTVNSTQHFFIASHLTPSKLPNPDGEDIILDIKAFTPDELYDALMQDRMKWSMTALGLFRLFEYLRRNF
jgi:8-oxo-dGTP pyrophosphatase MutT (NUDIX family)